MKLLSVIYFKIIITIFSIISLSCCSNGTTNKGKISSLDSLNSICTDLAIRMSVDSLRLQSIRYKTLSTPFSSDYYKALNFNIIADFNNKNYNIVISSINNILNNQKIADYPDIVCRYKYTLARAYQYNKNNKEAISTYKECFNINSNNPATIENIRGIVVNSILQLMNTYQIDNNPTECAQYFSQLTKDPTPIIRDYCMRDLKAIYAYSLYKADSVQKAEVQIKEALLLPLYNSSPSRLFRDYSYAAVIAFVKPNNTEETISYCKKAIDIANEYNISGAQWVTGVLANIYQQTGQIEESIELHKKSIETSKRQNDKQGEANSYNLLTNMFINWNLLEQANEFANLAIYNNKDNSSLYKFLLGESYIKKGEVMSKMNRIDSAYYYFYKAKDIYKDLPYLNGTLSVDIEISRITINNNIGDVNEAIQTLDAALSYNLTDLTKSTIYFLLAKAYINQENYIEGEKMLDSMYNYANREKAIFINGANKYALDYYLKNNNSKEIKRFSAAYLKETEDKFNERNSKGLTEAMIQFQTHKKEQQLKIAEALLRNTNLKIKLYIVILISLILIILFIVRLYRNKSKLYQTKIQLDQKEITNLIENLQEASFKSREIELQLKDLLSDSNKSEKIKTLTPQMFRERGEKKFRERFSLLYPNFLKQVKLNIPTITPNEEVICMLIVLEQSTDQMVDILCIEKGSVNMARHRLRKKMNLNKEDSLDKIIKTYL